MKSILLFLALAISVAAQVPDPGRVPVGKVVTLAVSAEGTPPYTYQWFKDGIPVQGKTESLLVLSPFVAEHAGLYHATVTNENGTATSNKVQLVPVKMPTKATITVTVAVGTINP